MKNKMLMVVALLSFGLGTAKADFDDNFADITDPLFVPSSVVSPYTNWYPPYQQSLLLVVSPTEFNAAYPVEGVSRPIYPVNNTPGCTWSVNGVIELGTTASNVPASKELTVTTKTGVYTIGLLSGASSRSLTYTPQSEYQIEVYDQRNNSWSYFSMKGITYLDHNMITISYSGDGRLNYYIANPLTGIGFSNPVLLCSQTNMFVDQNISNPQSVSLNGFNFGTSYYTAFWHEVIASTFAGTNAPGPILNAKVSGKNIILSWPSSVQNFSLQTTTNIADPNSWQFLSGVSVKIVPPQNVVTNSIVGKQGFYRLVQTSQ